MNWIAAFQLFTVGGLLIHFRPDQQGTTWGFILFVAGVISCGISLYQMGSSTGLFKRNS